ncbi:hypothetical protein HS088_TW20G00269 [Tripterygium wilfordii]|uniref:DNA sliding clamp PCNA n=1 Tax=Tripterygium wilfordii TaxID=458696 RepID=A0A7J7C711_TRIWF|nr:hypothetical protein HS088_TW20G00269 [Tripterygium wilfordii]
MFEIKLVQGWLLKRAVEAIKDLVTYAELMCSSTDFSLNAVDSNYSAFVSLLLGSNSFEDYNCEKSVCLGVNMNNLSRVLKFAGNDDIVIVEGDDDMDDMCLVFQSPGGDKTTSINMHLMDIHGHSYAIPDYDYDVVIRMSSSVFASICRNLAEINDTVLISVTKEGAMFSTSGETVKDAKVLCRQNGEEDTTTIKMKTQVSMAFSLSCVGFKF